MKFLEPQSFFRLCKNLKICLVYIEQSHNLSHSLKKNFVPCQNLKKKSKYLYILQPEHFALGRFFLTSRGGFNSMWKFAFRFMIWRSHFVRSRFKFFSRIWIHSRILLLNSIFSAFYCRPRTNGSAATEIATMLKKKYDYI